MNTEQILAHLARHNVKPTANRILIAEAISRYNGPVSMKELETKLQTIDKSSIFRTLTLFSNQHVVHQMEDGNDIVRYELCMSNDDETDSASAPLVCTKWTFPKSACPRVTDSLT